MKLAEYLYEEFRDLTTKYVSASQHLRELLPRFAGLPKAEELPTGKATKELLRELDQTEEEIEDALVKLRNVRRRLVGLL